MVREAQRHLAQWALQPVATMIAQEATDKLGHSRSLLRCKVWSVALDGSGDNGRHNIARCADPHHHGYSVMLAGFADGGLELRKRASGAMSLQGRFPYNKRAVLSDGGRSGRPKKEVIAPSAFAFRVNDPKADIHFLVGHSYDRPLASRGAGTLTLDDKPEALTFEASISDEMQEVSYVRDFLAALAAGLIVGLSPGFRIPPKRAVAEAETIQNEGHDPENGAHNAIIRTVHQALLYEISAVTRPAYDEAQIEARKWSPDFEWYVGGQSHPSSRWR